LSVNTKNISQTLKLNVLKRLLNSNELFNIACSKSGLSTAIAQKLLHTNHPLHTL